MNRTITISKQSEKYQALSFGHPLVNRGAHQRQCPESQVNLRLQLHQLCLVLSNLWHSGHGLRQCIRCLEERGRRMRYRWRVALPRKTSRQRCRRVSAKKLSTRSSTATSRIWANLALAGRTVEADHILNTWATCCKLGHIAFFGPCDTLDHCQGCIGTMEYSCRHLSFVSDHKPPCSPQIFC